MKFLQRSCLLLSCILLYSNCNSQTADWWNNNVHWDGQTHWSKYIMITSKYMGPNALSVPNMNNGTIDTAISFGVGAAFHFSPGDNTQNLLLYGNYTTRDNSISVDAQFIPYEQFQMSHEIKTERKTFYLDYYKKHVTGDVIANTTIRLFQRKADRFQAAIRLGLRMASGGGLTMARYGDVPGYWIDGGFGLPCKNKNWKWIAMVGFFAWQTNSEKYRQDDAIVFGSGFEWTKRSLKFQGCLSGYSGYRNNGDRPTLIRLSVEKRTRSRIYSFKLQQGLHDNRYFTIETGAKFILSK